MPYDPTIDPPDVREEMRPPPKDPPVDCQWCGDALSIVSENGEAWSAECDTCGAVVIIAYEDAPVWSTPVRAFEILARRVAVEWPFTADRAELLEHLRDLARDAQEEENKARKGVA